MQRGARPGADLAAEEARIAKARADADYLRHAHAELDRSSPSSRARRNVSRTQPCRHDAGRESRGRPASMRRRRWPATTRRSATLAVHCCGGWSGVPPQAPALIEPCVKALDAAIDALGTAGQALDLGGARVPNSIRTSSSGSRSGCSRCARAARKYAVAVDALPQLAQSFGRDLGALDAGEAHLVALAQAARQAEQRYRCRRGGAFDSAQARGGAARKGRQRRTCAFEAGTRPFRHPARERIQPLPGRTVSTGWNSGCGQTLVPGPAP